MLTAVLTLLQRAAALNDFVMAMLKEAFGRGFDGGFQVVVEDMPVPEYEENQSNGVMEATTRTVIIPGAQLPELQADAEEVLATITELAHVRCGKIATLRTEQNSKLGPRDFYSLYSLSMDFVSMTEEACGRTCYALRGAMVSQVISHFKFHSTQSMCSLC
jgi:hypothetical protein